MSDNLKISPQMQRQSSFESSLHGMSPIVYYALVSKPECIRFAKFKWTAGHYVQCIFGLFGEDGTPSVIWTDGESMYECLRQFGRKLKRKELLEDRYADDATYLLAEDLVKRGVLKEFWSKI